MPPVPIGGLLSRAKAHYPELPGADVLILSATGRQWKLEASALRNSSPYFNRILKEDKYHVSKKQRDSGQTIGWRIQLRKSRPHHSEDPRFRDFHTLEQKEKEALLSVHELGGEELCKISDATYDNLFRCFYGLKPDIPAPKDDNNESLTNYVYENVALLSAAEKVDGVRIARNAIELNLLDLGDVMWFYVMKSPVTWADIGVRLQSGRIFREAITHMVGRWHFEDQRVAINRKGMKYETQYGEAIERFCKMKLKELKHKKVVVEGRLAERYPERMLHPSLDPIPNRATYGEDIYLWQALVLFRQYFTNACLRNGHHRAKDGGVDMYRAIGSGGQAYFKDLELENFHGGFNMSTRGRACLKEALEFIKDDMKIVVEELLVDNLEGKHDVLPYLTCTEILEEEFPWNTGMRAADDDEE